MRKVKIATIVLFLSVLGCGNTSEDPDSGAEWYRVSCSHIDHRGVWKSRSTTSEDTAKRWARDHERTTGHLTRVVSWP